MYAYVQKLHTSQESNRLCRNFKIWILVSLPQSRHLFLVCWAENCDSSVIPDQMCDGGRPRLGDLREYEVAKLCWVRPLGHLQSWISSLLPEGDIKLWETCSGILTQFIVTSETDAKYNLLMEWCLPSCHLRCLSIHECQGRRESPKALQESVSAKPPTIATSTYSAPLGLLKDLSIECLHLKWRYNRSVVTWILV